MSSLNAHALSMEEQQQLLEEEDLENQIMIEREIEGALVLEKAITARFDDLVRLRQEIIQSQGMSRQMASEAEVILPGFTDKMPLQSFSTLPTKQNYQVSLEAISLGMAAAIAAGLAAVIALIGKFVSWFTGGSSSKGGSGGGGGGSGRGSVSNRMRAENEVLDEFVNKVEPVINETEKLLKENFILTINGKEYPVRSFRDIGDCLKMLGKESSAECFLNGDIYSVFSDHLIYDIVSEGSVNQFLNKNAPKFKKILPRLSKVIDDIGRFMTLSTKVKYSKDENGITDPGMQFELNAFLKEFGIQNQDMLEEDNGESFSAFVEEFSRVVTEAQNTPVKRMDYFSFVTALAKSITRYRETRNLIPELAEAYSDELEGTQLLLKQRLQLLEQMKDDDNYSENIKKSLSKVHQGFQTFSRLVIAFITQLKKYHDGYTKAYNTCIKIQNDLTFLFEHITGEQAPIVKDKMKDVNEVLRAVNENLKDIAKKNDVPRAGQLLRIGTVKIG